MVRNPKNFVMPVALFLVGVVFWGGVFYGTHGNSVGVAEFEMHERLHEVQLQGVKEEVAKLRQEFREDLKEVRNDLKKVIDLMLHPFEEVR